MAKCNTCRHRDKRNIDFPCIDCYLPEAEHYTPIVNEWISVKDRLPEEGEKVLIYTKTDITTFGLYTKNHGFDKREGFECGDGFMWMNTSSHWMPLPEPPEGE